MSLNSAAAPVTAGSPDPIAPSLATDEVLRIKGLQVEFATAAGRVRAVDGVDFMLRRGETLALVGESGSGKSISCLSILKIIEEPGRISGGEILYRGRDGQVRDLLRLDEREMRKIRGGEIAMIFQEPMTSLNPLYTVGNQIAEAVTLHRGTGWDEAYRIATDMLRRVGIADPERRIDEYPHQMSGGMRQRVMISMALSCEPEILIADEPTTALDVTIQAQILQLMRDLKQAVGRKMGIVFVTHNMGIVAQIADHVAVMYAGRVVEIGPVKEVFANPTHPYTRGLLASIIRAPRGRRAGKRLPLPAIRGTVPNLLARPPGCAFAPRCDFALPECAQAMPGLAPVAPNHQARCIRAGAI